MKKICILFVAILIAFTLKALNKTVAVFEPIGNIDKTIKEMVREEISSIIVNAEGWTVVERLAINRAFEETKIQDINGYLEDAQIIEIGKATQAIYILITRINPMDDNTFYVSFKLINLITERIEKQKTVQTSIAGNKELMSVVQITVTEMFAKEVPKPVTSVYNSSGYVEFTALNLQMTSGLGSYKWVEAKKLCEELELGEFNDWYLPTRLEFEMILKQNPTFKEVLKSWYWTSSEVDNEHAYNINAKGRVSEEDKENNGPDCMCVRKIK